MTMRALLSGLALLAVLPLAGCNPFGQGPDISIVSGSENTVLQPIVEEFCKQKNATCTFNYEGTLDIGLALQSDQGVAQDAVWPASSVWVDMFDTKRRVKSLTSIAQTPVVLGVRRSKAEQLGWIGKDVFMKDILAAVESGSLKFLMTSATQSNSGASAYLAMLSSAARQQAGDRARRSRRQTRPGERPVAAVRCRALFRLFRLACRSLCRIRRQGHDL
ncbi:substrate-binding domain-containing protein [Rhizobium laguerreae]